MWATDSNGVFVSLLTAAAVTFPAVTLAAVTPAAVTFEKLQIFVVTPLGFPGFPQAST